MVRLIDQDGTQLGVKSIDEAIRIAQDRGQDLVEVAPGANPPVCKVLDFSKYRYQREKERKEAKKHQKGGHVKEIRFRPKISPHDLDTKIRAMQKFLGQRHKVRVSVIFHGREMEHTDLGKKLLERVKENLVDLSAPEADPSMMGNRMIVMFAPKK
jgi:translation initiation factor IF-3